MRVIARKTLVGFVRKRVEPGLQQVLNDSLDDWHKRVSNASWNTSADLKAEFRSASIVTAERVVFNIKGNDYRLVALVDFRRKGVLILWIGTHREYDLIDVRKVLYDEGRYLDSSDPR